MGRMRVLIAGAALVVMGASGSIAAADAPEPTDTVMTMRIKGDVTFDTQGTVISHGLSTPVEPAITSFIDNAISHWRFKPWTQDGKPVNVHAPMQITLVARTLSGDRYDLRVDNVLFREDPKPLKPGEKPRATGNALTHIRKPGYPVGLLRSEIGGQVMVGLEFGPTGKVTQAVVVQSALFNTRGDDRVLAMARKMLEDACLQSARTAVISPGTEASATRPESLSGTLPFVFEAGAIGSTGNLGRWRLEQRGPKHDLPWMPAGRGQIAGVSDADGQGFAGLAAPYTLMEGAPAAL